MLLNDFLNHMEKTVFLEVEEPGTDLARRRIGFYERAGFCLNDFDYIQPDLQQDNLLLAAEKHDISYETIKRRF